MTFPKQDSERYVAEVVSIFCIPVLLCISKIKLLWPQTVTTVVQSMVTPWFFQFDLNPSKEQHICWFAQKLWQTSYAVEKNK